jgi:LmbE family N-acetylglucosaminyl deacetylase
VKAAEFLNAADALPFAGLKKIIGLGGIVVVAPHPDDESLGCGGLIAAARACEVDVRLIVVSDGVGSHPNSKLYPPARLKALREAETLSAVAALGLEPSQVRFIGLPDAAVPVAGALADQAVDEIFAAAADCAATALVVTWRRDPHCDHEASATLVDRAAARIRRVRTLAYPIWGWTLPPDTEVGLPPEGARLDITDHVAAKSRAIASHQSQTTALIADDPNGFRLQPSMLERFERPFEIFLTIARGETPP